MSEEITPTKSVSIELIASIFSSFSDKKKIKDIKNAVGALISTDDILERSAIDETVERVLREDRKRANESVLVYSKGYYSKRKRKPAPGETPLQVTEYTGRAGECAVMSELMFHQYNVNRMMIDEGIDIVATKDNCFYYIQVKTVGIRDGRVFAQIDIENFDKFIGNQSQVRYIIVVRSKEKDFVRNMYFTFMHQEIARAIYDRCIKRGERTISIKIKFNELTGEPILYDEREMSAKWNLNNFKL